MQFNRGLTLARFLHFYPRRVYLYGNLAQLSIFCRLAGKSRVLTRVSEIYYYPWHVARVNKAATEASIKRTYRRKMLRYEIF